MKQPTAEDVAAARRVLDQLDHSRNYKEEDVMVNRADAYRVCRLFILASSQEIKEDKSD